MLFDTETAKRVRALGIAKLAPEHRSRIAKKAARARWRKAGNYRGRPICGFIYLVAGAGLFKIGRAAGRSVANRIRELQCGSPVPLVLVHSVRVADVVRDERALHQLFAGARKFGEWFAISAEEGVAALEASAIAASPCAKPLPEPQTEPCAS